MNKKIMTLKSLNQKRKKKISLHAQSECDKASN